MDSFGERLKEERLRAGLSQEAFGEIGGVQKLAQRNYEKGNRDPNASYLTAIAAAGADIKYILTGERSTAAQPDSSTRSSSLSIDRERLEIAVEAVMEGLSETRRKLPPNKMAELILAAYDLISDSEQSKENIIRLVRMAA